jgi:hypothetical protein
MATTREEREMSDNVIHVPLEDIKTKAGVQARTKEISLPHVRALIEQIRARPEFIQEHPVHAVKNQQNQFLVVDGHHRLAAYKALRAQKVPVVVLDPDPNGPQQGWAYWLSFRENREHGLPLTKADRRRAALVLSRSTSWSDRKIAGEVGLDHKTVGRIRKRGVGKFPTSEGEGLPMGRTTAGPSTIERAIRFFLKVEDAGEWKVLGLFGGDRAKLLLNTIRGRPRDQQETSWRVLSAWADAIIEARRLRKTAS